MAPPKEKRWRRSGSASWQGRDLTSASPFWSRPCSRRCSGRSPGRRRCARTDHADLSAAGRSCTVVVRSSWPRSARSSSSAACCSARSATAVASGRRGGLGVIFGLVHYVPAPWQDTGPAAIGDGVHRPALGVGLRAAGQSARADRRAHGLQRRRRDLILGLQRLKLAASQARMLRRTSEVSTLPQFPTDPWFQEFIADQRLRRVPGGRGGLGGRRRVPHRGGARQGRARRRVGLPGPVARELPRRRRRSTRSGAPLPRT